MTSLFKIWIYLSLFCCGHIAPAQMNGSGMMYGGGMGMDGSPYTPPTLEQLNEQKENYEMVLDQFNQIRNQINNPQSNKILACGAQPTCSFREVCKDLQKNRNSTVLYRNSKGEELANLGRLKLEQFINYCVNNNRRMLYSVEVQQTQMLSALELQKKMTETFSVQQQASIKQNKELSETILKNHDAEKYQKVQLAMLDLILELPSQNNSYWQLPPKEMLEKAQLRAGVQLSEGTLQVLNKFNESLNSYSAYGGGGLYQNSTEQQHMIQPVANLTTENPFFEPELTVNPQYAGGAEKMTAYKNQVELQFQRGKKTFEDTRKLAIQALNSHKNEANKARIDNMIQRLNTVKLDLAPIMASACTIPNGYYDRGSHRISMCLSKLNVPEGDMIALLGHELGHAIDPCLLAFDLKKDEKENYFLYTPEEQDDSVDKLETVVTGIHYDQNPVGGVLTCLQNVESSLGANIGSPQDRARFEKERAEAVEGAGGEKSDSLDEKTQMTLQKKYRACASTADSKHSQMQEGFSDWFRGEVLRLRIQHETNPARRQELAYEALTSSASVTCFGLKPEAQDSIQESLKTLGCVYADNDSVLGLQPNARHSPTYKRVNNILLAVPEIAAAVGCKTTPGMVHCE